MLKNNLVKTIILGTILYGLSELIVVIFGVGLGFVPDGFPIVYEKGDWCIPDRRLQLLNIVFWYGVAALIVIVFGQLFSFLKKQK